MAMMRTITTATTPPAIISVVVVVAPVSGVSIPPMTVAVGSVMGSVTGGSVLRSSVVALGESVVGESAVGVSVIAGSVIGGSVVGGSVIGGSVIEGSVIGGSVVLAGGGRHSLSLRKEMATEQCQSTVISTPVTMTPGPPLTQSSIREMRASLPLSEVPSSLAR